MLPHDPVVILAAAGDVFAGLSDAVLIGIGVAAAGIVQAVIGLGGTYRAARLKAASDLAETARQEKRDAADEAHAKMELLVTALQAQVEHLSGRVDVGDEKLRECEDRAKAFGLEIVRLRERLLSMERWVAPREWDGLDRRKPPRRRET